ncbi:serine carboxypeptidase S28 [Colletotrichum navitas]|uniref:Serine carboxypeptidase S28 n=1 Tax=Colletotrichum navitas TaxID=681940 RepID=A0AAD8Q9H1_9PEZI|nr:serine carboxypeptidase S28 [Colletotrichum navitas]KAK1598240.1 serine carboxypeptidase S28 [Colletotrichum navitas]
MRRELDGLTFGGLEPRAHSGDQVNQGTFDQFLDHTNTSKGTFKQRYWWNAEHWGGPGFPVFMVNGGETNAGRLTGYLENGTLASLYAETHKGAIILIEHRYYGESWPFKTSTADTLQYLDVPQAIYDNIHFAQTANLPFDTNKGANANKSPWVLVGGSYAGALAAWTSVVAPGTFAAYHASSAVVQAIEDFWQFFTPIEQALPQNCSTDIKLVIQQVDRVLENGTAQEVDAMKQKFGLDTLGDHADFAWYLQKPIIMWAYDPNKVLEFCDWIETSTNDGDIIEGREESGVGLEAAWTGYTSWMHQRYNEKCREEESCNLYNNAVEYNTPDDLEWSRSWVWQLCNEPLGWWHTGPPSSNGTGLVSSYVHLEHRKRQCDLRFPQTSGHKPAISKGITVAMFNEWTGGWNASYENVLFIDGEFDPWKSATMSSDYRPGGPSESTEKAPRLVVEGATHVPDFRLSKLNAKVVQQEVEIMGKWIEAWKPKEAL